MGFVSIVLAIVALILAYFNSAGTLIVSMISVGIGVIGITKKDRISLVGILLAMIPLVLVGKNLIRGTEKVTDVVTDAYCDTYAINAKSYIKNVELAVRVNELSCKLNMEDTEYQKINDLSDGEYYFLIATSKEVLTNTFKDLNPSLAEQISSQTNSLITAPVKSSWGSRDVFGWVHFTKASTSISYSIALTDDFGHGISKEIKANDISGSVVETKDAKANIPEIIQTISSNKTSTQKEATGANYYFCTMK